MKKLVLSLLTVLSLSGFAQSFSTGNSNFSAGYGIGNFMQSVFKTYQTYDDFTFKAMGPMFFKYENALSDRLGIGINIAYANASVSYLDKGHIVDTTSMTYYKQTIKWSTYSVLARLNFHFANSEKFDPYWGFGVGYRGATWKYEDNDPNYDNDAEVSNFFPLGLELTVGARYYFTPAIGAYSEVGLAKAIVQFGLTANF